MLVRRSVKQQQGGHGATKPRSFEAKCPGALTGLRAAGGTEAQFDGSTHARQLGSWFYGFAAHPALAERRGLSISETFLTSASGSSEVDTKPST